LSSRIVNYLLKKKNLVTAIKLSKIISIKHLISVTNNNFSKYFTQYNNIINHFIIIAKYLEKLSWLLFNWIFNWNYFIQYLV